MVSRGDLSPLLLKKEREADYMETKRYKERLAEFINWERSINKVHMKDNDSFGNDQSMVMFVKGKEAVLKNLEKMLQEPF